ncbi:MAG: arginine--tRNA ligase [Nanoarchaeota archaeon]|nr:arginine--tRNA ligase [Nanoarchaeota archaeon]
MDHKKEILKILEKETGQKDLNLEIPPDTSLGDFAFPCFSLAKVYKKAPQQIAEELGKKIQLNEFIDKIEVKGPYLNFFIHKQGIAEDTIKKVLKEKDCYGSSKPNKDKIMVEFSQANTHKAFHVGHIRGTSLGESLARILEFQGYKVTRANYQGDTGMHVAKWIWCYKRFHSKEDIKKDEAWFAKIYVDAIQRLAKDETLQAEVDKINQALDEKSDKDLLALWKNTRKICLESLESIYKDLGARFDRYFFESQLEEDAKKIVKKLLEKNIAEISDDATIIKFKDEHLGVWVLLRKDGTVLYSAKDIALAARKFDEFKIDTSIYVVGKEQEHHFMQLFKTLELMRFKQAKNCRYVPVSLVKLPWGKMSSRTGDNILYSAFKDELIEYAKQVIKKRFPELDKKELDKRALAISIASMKYSMLKQNPNKEIVFNKEEAMRFEGDTGPYLQYSYARASSIVRKSKSGTRYQIPNLSDQEASLIKFIQEFPSEAEKAAAALNPALVANYAYRLCQLFNEFYVNCKVIGTDEEPFRLALVEIFRITLKNSLNLLGILPLEEM